MCVNLRHLTCIYHSHKLWAKAYFLPNYCRGSGYILHFANHLATETVAFLPNEIAELVAVLADWAF